MQEEVGYGLFAEEGKEKQEEGYGFFAPFVPHPDAAVATLIGDDTVPTVSNSGIAASAETVKTTEPATEATSGPPGGVERRREGGAFRRLV